MDNLNNKGGYKMEKVTGTITAVSNKGGKYGINMNSSWYNGFGDSPANKGDEVENEFEINGNFNNVKKVTVLKKSTIKPEESKELKAVPSQLTSYAKDLVVAMVYTAGKDTPLSIPEAMEVAGQSAANTYLTIKEFLEAPKEDVEVQ